MNTLNTDIKINPVNIGWRHILIVLLVITGAMALAHLSNIINNFSQFQWEDRLFFYHNQTTIHSLWDCFTKPSVWPGLYRPLTTNCYYFFGRLLFNNTIEGYHLINLLFFFINALLLFFLSRIFLPPYWAMLPAALFVSRFSHIEVVQNTVEFQALLSVCFSMLCILSFIHGRLSHRTSWSVFSSVSLVLALLSKETAVVVPLILALYGWLFDNRKEWKAYLLPFVISIIWVVLFITVFRGVSGYQPTGFKYLLSVSGVFFNYKFHMVDFFNLVTLNMDNIVAPERVILYAKSGVASSLFILLFVLSCFAMHKMSWAFRAGAAPRISFAFLFFIIAAAPFAILNGRLYMRYSYFGHVGLALFLSIIIFEAVSYLPSLRKRSGEISTPIVAQME